MAPRIRAGRAREVIARAGRGAEMADAPEGLLIGTRPALAVAASRLREGLARPLFAALLVLLGALSLALPHLVLFGFGDEPRIAREMGEATLRLDALVLALAFAAGAESQERARGARELLLARPLRPAALVLGRWLGTSALVLLLLASLSVALALSLKGFCPGVAARAALEGISLAALGAAAAEALPPGAAALATFAGFSAGLAGGGPEGAAGALGAAAGCAGWLALGAAIAEGRAP